MIRRLMAGLLVLGFIAAATVPALAQKDKDKKKDDKPAAGELKWKLEKDKVFYQTMETKTVQTMKIMGNDVNQTQTQKFYFSWKPLKVEADKAEIEQEILAVTMDIEIGGSRISYDSMKDTTANNPLGDFFKALVGSKFTVHLDTKNLKVTKVEGKDPFIKKLVAANPQMKQLLEQILSDDALKEMAEPTFAVIPTTKDTKWERKTTLNMGPIGTYENLYKYEMQGKEGKDDAEVARIKVETVLTYKEPGEAAGAGGLPFKIKSAKLTSSAPSGTILFNKKKGRLEKSESKLTLKGDLSIEIGGQVTAVNLSQTQDSTITTSDTDPRPKK
jgi:hypothetical protein